MTKKEMQIQIALGLIECEICGKIIHIIYICSECADTVCINCWHEESDMCIDCAPIRYCGVCDTIVPEDDYIDEYGMCEYCMDARTE